MARTKLTLLTEFHTLFIVQSVLEFEIKININQLGSFTLSLCDDDRNCLIFLQWD